MPAILAISASDMGAKSPTLLEAGRAWPSSHFTASSATSQILAARAHICLISCVAASLTATPFENVARLPPVRKV